MTLHARKTLFYTSVLVFLAAGAPLVLFTLGYRFSRASLSLTTTGGLFVGTWPTNASVSIDGTMHESSFITGSLFVQNLTPGAHQVAVSKSGYHPWEKTLVVEPNTVTEARVLLIPEELNQSILANGRFTDMRASPTAQLIVLTEQRGSSASLVLLDTSSGQLLTPASQQSQALAARGPLLSTPLVWTADERTAVGETATDWLQLTRTDTNTFRVRSLYQQSGLQQKLPRKPRALVPHPQLPDTYYVLDGTNLAIWDEQKSILKPVLQTIAGILVKQQGLLLLDNQSGLLYETSLDGTLPRPISLANVARVEQAHITESALSYGVMTADSLWFIVPAALVAERLAKSSISGSIADSERIVWWSGTELWIRWTVDRKNLPTFQTELTEKLLEMGEPIHNVFFYPRQDALIVHTGNRIMMLELDGRGGRIRTLLYAGTGENLSLFVSPTERAAFVLDGPALRKVALP